MGCAECRERLSEYMDGMLAGREMRRIAAHVAECESCAEELEDLRLTKLAVERAPVPEPTRDFWSRVYQRIEAEAEPAAEHGVCGPTRQGVPWMARIRHGWAGAAALTAAALAAALYLHPAQQASPSDDVDALVMQHAAHGACQPLGDWSRMTFVSCELNAASTVK